MTDLRTRIAKILRDLYEHKCCDECDVNRIESNYRHYLDDADAVIAELGLKSQWINEGIISDGPPPNWVLPCDIRYTTEWERSE